jgi:hypothetical protein
MLVSEVRRFAGAVLACSQVTGRAVLWRLETERDLGIAIPKRETNVRHESASPRVSTGICRQSCKLC